MTTPFERAYHQQAPFELSKRAVEAMISAELFERFVLPGSVLNDETVRQMEFWANSTIIRIGRHIAPYTVRVLGGPSQNGVTVIAESLNTP